MLMPISIAYFLRLFRHRRLMVNVEIVFLLLSLSKFTARLPLLFVAASGTAH